MLLLIKKYSNSFLTIVNRIIFSQLNNCVLQSDGVEKINNMGWDVPVQTWEMPMAIIL